MCKKLLTVLGDVLHPRMSKNICDRSSFLGISLQNSLKKIDTLWRNFIFKCCLSLANLPLELSHITCFEWHSSVEHGIKDYSCAPNVTSIAFITVSLKNFGCYISRRSTLFLHYVSRLGELAHTEITYLNVSLTRE